MPNSPPPGIWPPGLAWPGHPGIRGKKKGKGSTGHGNAYLASILRNAAVGAARTNTFLGDKYRRIARRRGSKRAIVALGRDPDDRSAIFGQK
jgi:hypothetical protein